MSDVLQVTVAGLPFFGRPDGVGHPNGCYLGPSGFKGWDSRPSFIREVIARQNAAGAHPTKGQLDARSVTLEGMVISPSAEQTLTLGERLSGLLATGESGRVVVKRQAGVQFADALLDTDTLFEPRGRTPRIADFLLQLWLPNPRKFGARHRHSGPAEGYVTTFNRGNFPAAAVLDVTGNMSGYTILGPDGRAYAVSQPVTGNQPHQINLATGEIRVGGIIKSGITTLADVWTVPPAGSAAQRLLPTSGDGELVATSWDTYI